MKINTKSLEGNWVNFKELFDLKIKPKSASSNPFTLGNQETLTISEFMWKTFDDQVVDWKEVTDEEGKALEFTPENKKMIFSYIEGVAEFVDKESDKLRKTFNKELKN